VQRGATPRAAPRRRARRGAAVPERDRCGALPRPIALQPRQPGTGTPARSRPSPAPPPPGGARADRRTLRAAQEALSDPAEAEALYRRALAADPAHVPSLCNLAVLLNERGAPTDAAALLQRALALDPGDATTLLNAADLERDAVGGDPRRAAALYARAADAAPPGDSLALCSLARLKIGAAPRRRLCPCCS